MIPLNTQPRERQNQNRYDKIDVVDVWFTIQGEGPFVGTPAVFVRLAGCNLQCPVCDTDYTSHRKEMETYELVDLVRKTNTLPYPCLVVFTGGEPLRQPIGQLCMGLLSRDFTLQLETNGTLYQDHVPYESMTVVCSPKAGAVNQRLKPHIDALKYVVASGEVSAKDGLPTTVLGAPVMPVRPWRTIPRNMIYVQPQDDLDPDHNKANMETAVASCLKFGYRLGIQTHKIAGVK